MNKNFIYYFSALFYNSSVYQRKIYLMFAVSHYDMICYYWQIDPLFSIIQNIQLNDKMWVFTVAFAFSIFFYKHLIFNWAYGWKLQEYMSFPLNYVHRSGQTNGYSKFCIMCLTIPQKRSKAVLSNKMWEFAHLNTSVHLVF